MKYNRARYKNSHDLTKRERVRLEKIINTPLSRKLRDNLLEIYPNLKKKESYRRLMAFILFSPFVDKDSGEVVIPSKYLGYIEKKGKKVTTKHYKGTKFLKEFGRKVMDKQSFKWSDHRYIEGKARCVTIKLDESITKLIEEEDTRMKTSTTKVTLPSGRIVNKKELWGINRQEREDMNNSLPKNHPARPLIEYLHSRSPNFFVKRMNEHYEEMKEAILKLPPSKKIGDKNKEINLKVLRQISYETIPIYAPSMKGRTDRIFTSYHMQLPGSIRKIMYRGCYDYDLESSQLAICGKLWNVSEINDLLESGKSIWISFMEYLGTDMEICGKGGPLYNEVKKEGMKEFLYSVTYGMEVRNLRKKLRSCHILEKHSKKKPEKLLLHPVIKALLKARKYQLDELLEKGEAVTCFGRKIKVKNMEDARSALSQLAQAVELDLLLPALELAKSSKGEIQIVLWCHDGFVIALKWNQRFKTWDRRIRSTVAEKIKQYGMKTRLEFQEL
jgi:hypothetical protein